MDKVELELLAEKIHKVYCKQYLKDKGEQYWTKGDYFKLNERTKEYDRAIVRFLKQYASEVSREITVKFINYLIDSDISIDLSTNTLELFDEWKSKQEDK